MPTNYGYTDNIPAGGNNPSQDRPLMTENFNSIDGLIGEDHVSFNLANGGFHNQIRMPTMTNMPSPANRISSSITEYAKVSGQSQLFITNGQSTNEYQLTLMDNTNAPTFGVFTGVTYAPNSLTGSAGWTFLPGGLRLQYGTVDSGSFSTSEVIFPIAYTTVYIVTINYVSTSLRTWQLSSYDNNGFTFIRDSNASARFFTWSAIGI